MAFEPKNITRNHVLTAIEKIVVEGIGLINSNRWLVEINGKLYPPKEVMRYAHEQMNGENLWKLGGGESTNSYLENIGFKVIDKTNDRILSFIETYKEHLRQNGLNDEIYKWKLLNSFRGKPEITKLNFTDEIQSVDFQNLVYYNATRVIKHISNDRPEEYRELFRMLFDESLLLQDRITNFDQGVSSLFQELEPEGRLYHQHDERTIANFLTYHNPEKYSFYKDSFYKKYCKLIGVTPKKRGEKYAHYLELVNDFIHDYIEKDIGLIELIQPLLIGSDCFKDENHLILAQDILYTQLENTDSINSAEFKSVIAEVKSLCEDDYFVFQKPTSKYVWISDKQNIIGNLIAHYEISIDKAKGIYIVDIHFEGKEKTLKEQFKPIIDNLPPELNPINWQGSKSIRYGKGIPIETPDLINKLIEQLVFLEVTLGDRIRNIISLNNTIMENQKLKKESLNQILFGPPGTGKTYNTINKAIHIINPDFNLNQDRKIIKQEFERLMNKGQIVFTTFHQSMSYEDFIEGIKPQKPEENDTFLRYDIEPGVFKSICNKAKSIKQANNKIDWDTPKYYKMSLGGKDRPDLHEWCVDNNVIALGWGGNKDLKSYSSISNWQEYREKFTKQFPELVTESRFNIQATYAFMNMKENDIVVISKGNHLIDAIGVVKGSYYWDDKNPVDFYHYRQVEWVVKNVNTSPDRFFKKQISQMAIYEFYPQDIIKEAFKEITGQTADATSKPYVLIIDEINRGNVSQIFGELITLIEEDKRLGNSESLEVTLPYSKEKFGVPPNLHIIGTMNTADRSVEALDTALRRRFSFEEIASKPSIVAPNRCFWELLWKYKGIDWENKEYRSKEKELLDLLGASSKVWDERKTIWEKFKKEGKNENQIEFFSNSEFTGINFESLLENINFRIEKLLDKDHQIGHSYFMCVTNLEDLKSVFYNKIIPLLQEYFYGDFGKIGLVLGDSFVKKEVNDSFKFATFRGYENQSDLLERPVYIITNSDNWDFKSIYE